MGWAAVVTAGLLFAAVIPTAKSDQVYKSVDAQGHVTYSDRPNAAGAQKTEITVQQGDPKEAARLAKEGQVLGAQDEQRKKQQLTADKNKAQQEKDRQARCQAAKDHYNSIKEGRLYKRDPDGNRQFMTDSEADAQRETARQVMNTACGT
jgi:preprotein translocase subunit SecD